MKNFSILIAVMLLLAGCSTAETETGQSEPQVSVSISLAVSADVETRSDDTRITALWYAIADADGNVFSPRLNHLASDFSQLTIEGLKAGDYTLAFLATSAEHTSVRVADPTSLNDEWLVFDPANPPLDEQWFYQKVELHITPQQLPIQRTVSLERCVGRTDIALNFESEYVQRFVRSVKIAFDGKNNFFSALEAGGEYSSSLTLGVVDITDMRTLYTLPSQGPVSGKIIVTAARSDGSEYTRSYSFSNLEIQAGHVSRIEVDVVHPEESDGIIYVRDVDYERFRPDTMFLSTEPQSVFYDHSQRWFYPDQPLQASVDKNHQLLIRFYSPVAISDVTVRCRFNRVSTEFFDFAHFDTVLPFMEAVFPIPVTSGPKSFTSADGRKVTVPAQPELSNDDVTFEIVCNDPFMQKIATIDSHWLINFSAFAADEGHAYWRHMTPELCRHGVALALNMAVMFASEEFNYAMNAYDGKLLDNQSNPINLDELRRKIRQHAGLTLGHVTGVGGLGGGSTYGLADYCYHEVYWDWNDNPFQNPHTYVRQAMFHEYGHCLGYSHDSTMTYGDQWTVLCAEVFVRMGSQDKLPVSSKNIIANLPM